MAIRPVDNFFGGNVPDDWVEGDPIPAGVKATSAENFALFRKEMLDYAEALVKEVSPSVLTISRPGSFGVGIGMTRFVLPSRFLVTRIRASVGTSGTGVTRVDLLLNGASIYTTNTKPEIPAGQKRSASRVPNVVDLPIDGELALEVEAAGTGAAHLTVTLLGRWSA